MLLTGGIAVGAVAVVIVQERYLPPRLSAGASAELRHAFEQVDVERNRLRDELRQASQRIEAALSQHRAMAEDLAASRATSARLRDDLASVVTSLPPDPRGGSIAVRAGRFTAKDGMLNYDVVLTRERGVGKPTPGSLQFIVAGESERGAQATVKAQAIPLSLGSHEVVRGSLPLPDGFRPRQTTVQVLDRVAGKSLGMRVLPIR